MKISHRLWIEFNLELSRVNEFLRSFFIIIYLVVLDTYRKVFVQIYYVSFRINFRKSFRASIKTSFRIASKILTNEKRVNVSEKNCITM